MMFHPKCGSRIKIINDGKTAKRNASEFNFGLVFSKDPLPSDELFEIRIDKKNDSWIGSLEVGVTTCDPENIALPPSAVDLKPVTWLLSGKTVMKDGKILTEFYPLNLEKLVEGERVGILRTSQGELEFYVNGVSFGVAATNIPLVVFAFVNVYGRVAQVSVVPQISPPLDSSEEGYLCALEEHNLPMEATAPSPAAQPTERLRFHERTGALVKLSGNGRTAERLRPMDEFNNAVVISHRPLLLGQLFEIRMEKVVDKWYGSIEVGVTCHDPDVLSFPATMTNMSSGTVMMSGCGILTNGKGSKRQYGMYNLDQLRLGDRIGMMIKPNGDLHYFINGMDQGVAASNIPPAVWAVVDLYGMAVKVSIVDRDQREEQNLITRRNVAMDNNSALALADLAEDERLAAGGERLLFHINCGSHARVINSGLTALRPNALDDFNNAVVLTNRPLAIDEVFEVRLEKMVSKWAGSIEVGVTTHGPTELDFPSTMTNVRSGTWIMTGAGVMHNGQSVIADYGTNLDRLGAGDRVGLVVRAGGSLHFLVNGVDQGEAASGLPPVLYAVVDLYGQASQASIVAQCSSCAETPTGPPSVERPIDIHFHSVHGRNARVSNNGRTASRPRAMAEFNDAIVVTNRPLGRNEMFTVVVERIVDRWSGSIEAGVTAIPPNDLKLPGTMTDLEHDTWMLSGFAVMKDGVTLKQGYPLNLDKVVQGSMIGMMRHDEDATLHYYLDGVDMGPACGDIPRDVYPCIDLYGQCAQVSIISSGEPASGVTPTEETPLEPTPAPIVNKIPAAITPTVHKLMVWHGDTVIKTDVLVRESSTAPLGWLRLTDWAEVVITERSPHLAGSLVIGVTAGPPPLPLTSLPKPTYYVIGGDLYGAANELIKSGAFPSLDWLRPGSTVGLRLCSDSTVRLYINSIDQGVVAHSIKKPLYFVVQVSGSTCGVKVVSHSGEDSPRRNGEAPLASLDAESPPAAASPPDVLRPNGAEASCEKAVEDMEKSVDEGDKGIDEDAPVSASTPINTYPPLLRHQMEGWPVFHECHGRNIQLSSNRLAAKRTASYNQGIVLSSLPLSRDNPTFQVRVECTNSSWTSGLSVGVTSQTNMQACSLALTALGLRQDAWVVCGRVLYHNSHFVKAVAYDLNGLTVGAVVGLTLETDNTLKLVVNGAETTLTVLPPLRTYTPLVDLYGTCDQVSLVVDGYTASGGDWGSSRRMVSSWADPTTSRSKSDKMNENISLTTVHQSAAQRWASVGELRLSPATPPKPVAKCDALSVASRLIRWLVLPKGYFSDCGGECMCASCRSGGMIGRWTRFPLKTTAPPAWLTAYSHQMPVAAVRQLLDSSSLPFSNEERWQGATKESEGREVRVRPNPVAALPEPWPGGVAAAVAEVAVRPGSYKVDDSADWVTKESNATVITAILFCTDQ